MGRASSNKKVARAARAGGRRPPGQHRNLLFPGAIAAVVVLGVILVGVSRGGNADADLPPRIGDHWHAAYGIYDCDEFLPPLGDIRPDEDGIHTHRDGLVHMHPFTTGVTGRRANLSAWGEQVGLDLNDDSFSLRAEDIERRNGDDCNGQPGVVKLRVWDGPGDEEGRFIESDLDSYRPQDGSVLTIAFVPEGTEVPRPPSAINLEDPLAAEEGRLPPTATSTSTTAPPAEGEGEGGAGTTTTSAP